MSGLWNQLLWSESSSTTWLEQMTEAPCVTEHDPMGPSGERPSPLSSALAAL